MKGSLSFMPKKRSKLQQAAVDAAKKMPPLFHKLPGEDFDIRKSRTLWWLIKQPEVLNYVWNVIQSSKAIIYDSDIGKWKGVDFENDEDDE